MTFPQQLSHVAETMETVLGAVIPTPQGPHAIIMEAMRYAAMGGGKRLRPFLTIETARLFGEPSPPAWQAAAALECIHVYSLIHDDLPCMDDDDLRRGKPTVHKAYGEAVAVLAGDGLQTLAFTILSNLDLDAETRLSLIKNLAFASGVDGMVGGQVIDMIAPEHERDEALISQLQAMKTGALIVNAVQAGAVLGGADEDQIIRLMEYAKILGLIFQIKDDILDIEGDATVMGKATRKDDAQGKVTFVSILGLEKAKARAEALGDTAKGRLDVFGENAKTLCDTVDFVLNRSR